MTSPSIHAIARAPMRPIRMDDETCRNCDAPLRGAFCDGCGQKRFVDADRRLAHLLSEGLREITSVDGKLWRTLRLLFLKPGVLSREYIDGRRARYYSPIGLFVIASVLYFFAPALTDFNLPFADQVPGSMVLKMQDPASPLPPDRVAYLRTSAGQMHSVWTAPLVERMVERRRAHDPSYGMRRLADDYDHQAGNVGKALMIVHVPFIALALALVFWRRRMYFAEHFVVALHLFTFLLLFVQVVLLPVNWLVVHAALDVPALRLPLVLATLGTLLGYILCACRTAYRSGWLAAAIGLFGVVVALWFANLYVYRALQFVVTLWLV